MLMMNWALPAALLLGILVWCYRKTRRGLRTLDDDRKSRMEQIAAGERRLAEERKNISADEHLSIVRAAIEDLLRLNGLSEGYSVALRGRAIEVSTPEGPWLVELAMSERKLKTSRRVLRGRGRWVLSGFGHWEERDDPASLMRSLNERLRSPRSEEFEKAHFARRFSGRNIHPEKSGRG